MFLKLCCLFAVLHYSNGFLEYLYSKNNYPNKYRPGRQTTFNPNFNQGFPNQGFQNQGFPNQGFPNQGFPNQGFPGQGFPNQGFPNQGFPNQGFNPNGDQFSPENNLLISTTTTPRPGTTTPEIPGMGTTQSACEDRCLTTPQYNPVCGDNNITYNNPARLQCAQNCGVRVQQARAGVCPRSVIAG